MPRTEEITSWLLERARRLQLLDGHALVTRDGPMLVWLDGVRDVDALVAACQDGAPPDRSTVTAALVHRRTPVMVSARWLAGTQRALVEVEGTHRNVLRAATSGTRFHGRDVRDPAWRRERRARLDLLSDLLHAPPARARDAFGAILELVAALHGEASRAALAEGAADARRRLRSRRPEAKTRVATLLARLGERATPGAAARGDDPDLDTFLDRTVADLRAADRRPGRARARLVRRLVAAVIAYPDAGAPADPGEPVDDDLIVAVRQLARAWLTARPARGHAGAAAAVAPIDALAGELGLRFAATTPIHITAEHVRHADALRASARLLARPGLAIDLASALAFLLLLQPRADGGSPLVHTGELTRFLADADADTVRAYVRYTVELVPHYTALGVKLDVSPEKFVRLARGRSADLSLLLHNVVLRPDGDAPLDVEREVAVLDATLGLYAQAPARARHLLAELQRSTDGAGRRAHAAFAAWLGDDALLDRYVHLARLAGEPAPSRALLTDFERAARQERERAHLAGLARRDARQEARLAKLAAAAADPEASDAARTRRRMLDRLSELLARAYRRRLDEVLLVLVREAWGVRPPALTPAWRDVLRFRSVARRNGELLDRLVQLAGRAPGQDIRRDLPPNRAWAERMRGKLDIDAWLAPRSRPLVLGDRRYQLATEQDPLEVLRMGIPFATCLSLRDGENAESTVINALDANKRVLYLRDERGQPVARQLVTLTAAGQMLCYQVYTSIDPGARPAIEAAFEALRAELATAAGVTAVANGKAEQLHAGFWYDDGPIAPRATPEARDAVDDDDRAVRAYCERLGRPVPDAPLPRSLVDEARVVAARDRGDHDAAAPHVERYSLVESEWLTSLIQEEGLAAVARRARDVRHLDDGLAMAARDRPLELLAAATTHGLDLDDEAVAAVFAHAPRTPASAAVLLAYGERLVAERPADQNYPYIDRVLAPLDGVLETLDVGACLAVLERLDPLLPHARDEDDRRWWEHALVERAVAAYRRAPAPERVLRILRSRAARALPQRAALAIAARCPTGGLAAGTPAFAAWWQPPVRCREARVAIDRLLDHRPEWTTLPEALAARWRQWPVERDRRDDEIAASPAFDAVAELALHLPALADPLAAAAAGRADGKAWQPDAWELFHERRHPDPRRRARLLEAARVPDDAARHMLALLGDVAGLRKLHASADVIGLAQVVAAQLGGDATAVLGPPELPALAVDPATIATAARAAHDGRPGPWFAVLERGHAPATAFAELLDRAIAGGGDPAGPARASLATLLRRVVPFEVQRVPRAAFARWLRDPELRAPVLAQLAKMHTSETAAVSLREIERADEAPADPDHHAAMRAALHVTQARPDHAWVSTDGEDRAERTRLFRAVLAELPAERAFSVYQGLSAGAEASLFLDQLAHVPEATRAAFFAHAADATKHPDDPERRTRDAWIAAAAAAAAS